MEVGGADGGGVHSRGAANRGGANSRGGADLMVPVRTIGFWGTMLRFLRSSDRRTRDVSTPSIRIRPENGSTRRNRDVAREDLPGHKHAHSQNQGGVTGRHRKSLTRTDNEDWL